MALLEFSWWLSPGAAWFIFFNAVVGAIAVMSWGQSGDRARTTSTRRALARTASTVVMEHLRSLSIFSFHSTGDYGAVSPPPSPSPHLLYHVQHHQYSTFHQEQEAQQMAHHELPEIEPAPVLSGKIEATATTAPPSAPIATTTAAVPLRSEEKEEESISLDEAYALASARRQAPAAVAVTADTSASRPAKVRACGRGAEEVEGKAEVNARAERFIRKFREDLKLERINSILNYTNALRRGAGAKPPR